MPNICSNWVRITSNCADTIELFAAQPLRLDMIDQQPSELNTPPHYNIDEWIEKYWSTKWINGSTSEQCDILWKREADGSLVARFFSAWSPPVAFYKRIAETYPQLRLEYEYAVWEMACAGYGTATDEKPSHFVYDSKEEMEELKQSREWHVTIWNPHFE
jgi:hypothetical protein